MTPKERLQKAIGNLPRPQSEDILADYILRRDPEIGVALRTYEMVQGMRVTSEQIRAAIKTMWTNGIMESDEAIVRAAAEQMAHALDVKEDLMPHLQLELVGEGPIRRKR